MKKVLIVMKETYLRQVKSLAFLFMVLAPFLFIGLSLLSGMLGASSAESNLSSQTALISSDKQLISDMMALGGYTDQYKDRDSAQQALEDEEIAAYLIVEEVDGQLQANYHGNEIMPQNDKLFLTQALTNAQNKLNQERAGLSPDQVATLATTFNFTEEIVEGKEFEKLGQYVTYFGLVFFMYMILITYSSQTAQEVASEKGTKIMEVIFSSVPAPLYFYGKILGILAVIATHIGIYVVGGFIGFQLAKEYLASAGFLGMIQSVVGNLSLNTLLFVIFGLFIYVVFAALCGSLVARMEDVQKAVSPVMMVIMVAFFGAMFLGQSGSDNLIMKVGSFVPFLSTFFMPIRVINGFASTAEAWGSLAILIAVSFGLVYYIGKSYAGLILQTDDIGLWKSFKKGISSR
ncbi:ABC transporter permease [Streptococcus ovuberis]|uniref:ABC transporter permease n=1 Tax=Streptococcus ovuberis TaxID=1936207 RepID=A0A7X6S0E6_9STRE|nr:ABC transporter permease [Streptococcus ovuberis]NKZ20044.1 ABC transporter permease [Streptococcus ovuberis]